MAIYTFRDLTYCRAAMSNLRRLILFLAGVARASRVPVLAPSPKRLSTLSITERHSPGICAGSELGSQPNYPDTTALPSAGQSALWKYKAIYRLHDEQVGQWSDVISTTVAG